VRRLVRLAKEVARWAAERGGGGGASVGGGGRRRARLLRLLR
jgi:hypothetical protein